MFKEYKYTTTKGIGIANYAGKSDIAFVMNHEDLESAFKTASDVVNKYKMVNSVEDLLTNIKNELRSELSQNAEEINRLKNVMLKNEVITLDDI